MIANAANTSVRATRSARTFACRVATHGADSSGGIFRTHIARTRLRSSWNRSAGISGAFARPHHFPATAAQRRDSKTFDYPNAAVGDGGADRKVAPVWRSYPSNFTGASRVLPQGPLVLPQDPRISRQIDVEKCAPLWGVRAAVEPLSITRPVHIRQVWPTLYGDFTVRTPCQR